MHYNNGNTCYARADHTLSSYYYITVNIPLFLLSKSAIANWRLVKSFRVIEEMIIR